MLHMDPSATNIRLNNKGEYIFIDWEEGRIFNPRHKKVGCIFCLFAEFIMVRWAIINLTFASNPELITDLKMESQRLYKHAIQKTDLFIHFLIETKAYSANYLNPASFNETSISSFLQLMFSDLKMEPKIIWSEVMYKLLQTINVTIE